PLILFISSSSDGSLFSFLHSNLHCPSHILHNNTMESTSVERQSSHYEFDSNKREDAIRAAHHPHDNSGR
ncbi:hypothetical protein PFISCL1PPCAC_2335, partial [Pristionchus fissidentatus]